MICIVYCKKKRVTDPGSDFTFDCSNMVQEVKRCMAENPGSSLKDCIKAAVIDCGCDCLGSINASAAECCDDYQFAMRTAAHGTEQAAALTRLVACLKDALSGYF